MIVACDMRVVTAQLLLLALTTLPFALMLAAAVGRLPALPPIVPGERLGWSVATAAKLAADRRARAAAALPGTWLGRHLRPSFGLRD
jgi:hypothetical protein